MKAPGHILVIRLSAMGDVAMTVPVLKEVANKYPGLRFSILTRKFFSPLFHDIPNAEIIEAETEGRHKGLPGLLKLAGELRNRDIDAVADLHNVLRSNVLKIYFKFHGITVKQIDKGRKEKKSLTRPTNKNFKQLKTTHQRYADVFSALGYPIEKASCFFSAPKDLPPAVKEAAGAKTQKWIGVAPFARHKSKTYPPALMKDVLHHLEHVQNIKIFLFGGGKQEIHTLNKWEKELQDTVSIAGKYSFEEELALISNLDAMVSMDSGNGHIAANYGVPVITVWGLTHPFTGFAPYCQPITHSLIPDLKRFPQIPTSVYGTRTPPGYENVMETIPPEMIVKKIKKILKI